MREQIRAEIAGIAPLDHAERDDQIRALDWLNSEVEIFRLAKPATPPQHLVSYFALVDGEYLLLVDHINAQLWLPNGGHVDPGEHPKATVLREAMEELGIEAEFLIDEALFLTITETVGLTAGHTDVSIWYVLRGDRTKAFTFDDSEFSTVRWFHKDSLPHDRAEPNLNRFVSKLYDRDEA